MILLILGPPYLAVWWLAWNEDAMLTALRGVPELDRGRCRAAAEHRFSLQRMARDHERLYRRLTTAVLDRQPRPVNGSRPSMAGMPVSPTAP